MINVFAPIFRRRNTTFLPGGLLPPLKLVEQKSLAAAAASVTFSSIASTIGTHLVVEVYAALSEAIASRSLKIRFNGDTANNYNGENLRGNNTDPTASIDTGASGIQTVSLPGTSQTGFGGGFILIPHAFNTTKHKNTLAQGGAAEDDVIARVGRWANTAAITSITLIETSGGSNLVAGSILTLWAVDDSYLLDSSILSGADGTFSFTSIPAQYASLCVIGDLRSAVAGTAGAADFLDIQFNGDSTATNYNRQRLAGNDTTAAAASDNNDEVGVVIHDNETTNAFSPFIANILSYAEGDNDPAYIGISGRHNTLTDADGYVYVSSGRRNNVAVVNRVDILTDGGEDFKDGSGLWFYGIPKPRSRRAGRVVLSADQATIDFTSLPQNYRKLTLELYANTDAASVADTVNVTFNGDTDTDKYDRQILYGTGTGSVLGVNVVSARSASTREWMHITGDTEGDNEFGVSYLTVNNYASTVGHKHAYVIDGRTENIVMLKSCRYESANGIKSVSLSPQTGSNFQVGTIAILTLEK